MSKSNNSLNRLSAIAASFVLAGICLTSMVVTGCLGTHKITIAAGQGIVESCPTRARAGEKVTVRTFSVTDAYIVVTVNGNEDYGKFLEETVYEFTMPDHDVNVRVLVEPNGLA